MIKKSRFLSVTEYLNSVGSDESRPRPEHPKPSHFNRWLDSEYKHDCVLSNAGLSNAPTKTGICTSLKSDVYFRFHSPLNAKSALLNFNCTWDLVLICWKMWSPEPENCQNLNPHTSKIVKLLPVCLTNNRCRSNLISEPHAKFSENR